MEWVREFRISTPKQKLGEQSADFHGCIWQIQMTYPRWLQSTSFSALRRLKNYLRSTMKQGRLNNCCLMHCLKSITNTLYTWRWLVPTNNAKGILEKLSRPVIAYGWVEDNPPPLPERKEDSSIKWWWKQNINLATWNIKTPYIFKILGLTNNGAVWAWYFDLDKAWIALFCKIKILFKWVLYVDDQTILQ